MQSNKAVINECCGHCRNKGLPFEGHLAKNCKELAKEICNRCGCEGHLLSYCKLTYEDELHLEDLDRKYKIRVQFPPLPKKSEKVKQLDTPKPPSTNWAKTFAKSLTPEEIEKETKAQEDATEKSRKIKQEKYEAQREAQRVEQERKRCEWEAREKQRKIIKEQNDRFHKEHMIRKYGWRWFIQVDDTPNDCEEAEKLRNEERIREELREEEHYYRELASEKAAEEKRQKEEEYRNKQKKKLSPEEFQIWEYEIEESLTDEYEAYAWNSSQQIYKYMDEEEAHKGRYNYWLKEQVNAGAIVELENGGYKYHLERLTKDHEYLYV